MGHCTIAYPISASQFYSSWLQGNVQPTTKIYHQLRPLRRSTEKFPRGLLNRVHPQPVSAVYQGRSTLGLFDKMPEEMGFRIVYTFDASFGDNAAAVRLKTWGQRQERLQTLQESDQLPTPITSTASFSCFVTILAILLCSGDSVKGEPLCTCTMRGARNAPSSALRVGTFLSRSRVTWLIQSRCGPSVRLSFGRPNHKETACQATPASPVAVTLLSGQLFSASALRNSCFPLRFPPALLICLIQPYTLCSIFFAYCPLTLDFAVPRSRRFRFLSLRASSDGGGLVRGAAEVEASR